MVKNLIRKYNVPGPRYTSYPPVPAWNTTPPSRRQWACEVADTFSHTNATDGISLYIHLPFCESLCTYCGCNTRITVNHQVEKPYLDTLLKEWQLYLQLFDEKPRIAQLHLGGGTPTFFSPENLQYLIEGIRKTADVLPDAELGFEGHPNNTTKAHLKTLYEQGFTRMSLGIQDFDPVVQKTVNRIQTFETVQAVVREARRTGYTSINFDLIYGLPKQTARSVTETIDKVALLKPERIAFYSYAHVPWVKPGQRSFTEADLPDNETKRHLYELGKEKLQQLGYEEIGMDHFALPEDDLYKAVQQGTLHRNFMGYTPRHTRLMVGLGASSISDSWGAYGQNIKAVEEYQRVVNMGEFPVFKGHILTEEELITRRHISELMCKFYTAWEGANGIPFSVKHKLKAMAEDGIVAMDAYAIRVLPAGRPFVRNVCMIIDPTLRQEVEGKQVFSKVI